MQCFGGISKNNRMISVHFQGKPFNITAIHVYAAATNTEETEVDSAGLTRPSRINAKKKKKKEEEE